MTSDARSLEIGKRPVTDAETFSYREMWPHLVVLRDDGKLASDGLYEMDEEIYPIFIVWETSWSTATALAPATATAIFQRAYGDLLDRARLDHLTVVTLDAGNAADGPLGAHRGAGRFAYVDVSESSHLDLVWDVAVHDSLVDTIRRHESSRVQRS